MMDRTDRHFRVFLRGITRYALLYTEMIHSAAILRGGAQSLLEYSALEKPLALQLGGEDPSALAACARIAEDLGYDEVNLNAGCPSPRVQKGRFGACLMAAPERVAEAVAAMRAATALPITVKHRLCIGAEESYAELERFVRVVATAGCDRCTVHARRAVLEGLDPHENRTVPPLRYDLVHRLAREHPALSIELNGGVRTLAEVRAQLEHVDAVMMGRIAYEHPFVLASADRDLFGAVDPVPTRQAVLEAFLPYAEREARSGTSLQHLYQHLGGLYAGEPGARAWRRAVAEACRGIALTTPHLEPSPNVA